GNGEQDSQFGRGEPVSFRENLRNRWGCWRRLLNEQNCSCAKRRSGATARPRSERQKMCHVFPTIARWHRKSDSAHSKSRIAFPGSIEHLAEILRSLRLIGLDAARNGVQHIFSG